jgi:hypothetical protein
MHWYTIDGNPCHTQPTKKGAKNKERPTDIRDAKRLGLLPSVSGIVGCMANQGLMRYKLMEVAKASFRAPYIGHEDEDEYVSWLLAKGEEDAAGAADLGSLIHKVIELKLTGCVWAEIYDQRVKIADGWLTLGQIGDAAINILKGHVSITTSEQVLVNAEAGYAGTTDVMGISTKTLRNSIADFKSKRTKPGKPVEPSDSHPLQIAAYHMAAYGHLSERETGYNVYISTTELMPDGLPRIEVREWSGKELLDAWEAFQSCCTLWRYLNQYDPRA